MVTTPKLTYQDYANMDGDERYELHDGELILVASPNMDHQEAVTNLGTSLSVFVKEHDLGKIYFAPTDVLFTDTEVVQPDLLFISNEREHIRTPANIQGAPDLIVEVLSPSSVRRDWRYKRELYASSRRARVLDRRPRPPDRVSHAASGRRTEYRRHLHGRRHRDFLDPRRFQHQPERDFQEVTDTWQHQSAIRIVSGT